MILFLMLAFKPVDPMLVLKQSRDTMLTLKSYRTTCVRKSVYDDPKRKNEYAIALLTLQKPNKMRYDEWDFLFLPANVASAIKGRSALQSMVCDGKQRTTQIGSTYGQEPYRGPLQLQNPMGIGLEFFSAQLSEYDYLLSARKKGQKVKVSYDGTEKVGDVECQKVTVVSPSTPGQLIEAERETFFLGAKDHLLHRVDSYMKFKGAPSSNETIFLRDIVLNGAIKPAIFVYVAPPGVKPRSPGGKM